MEDFARCASLLASPSTDPALRAQADAWLAAFRSAPDAWAVGLAVLRAGSGTVPPEVRLQAASLLAWKAKRQLGQLQPPERQAELAEALTVLLEQQPAAAAAAADGQRDVAVRGVCLALANLAIQCNGWARPLDTLGPRLSQARMLEFLTLLPQECEDAVAAAQAASAELAWGLKARAHEWSPEVAAWLHALHSGAAAASASSSGSPAGPRSPHSAGQHPAACEELQQLTLAVLRCFSAWVKWGALQYIEAVHAQYFASLAGELLFAADPARGLAYHPACLPAAVDAATDIVEHATEELQPLLLQLAAALPARAMALHAGGSQAEAEELCHVFSLFCSTHSALCAAEGPQGQALRQGLLQLLALPMEPGSDSGGAALPAMGALSDLLEHVVAQRQGEGASEEEGGADNGQAGSRLMCSDARRAFAAASLDVLLAQLQPFEAAFHPRPASAATSAPVQRGMHSPEGVPHALRHEAAPVIDHLGHLLGVDAVVARLAAHAEAAVQRHGAHSMAAQAALDACLHVLEGTSGVLEACCCERFAADTLPEWLPGFLTLYALVPQVDGSRQPGAGDAAPLTILHADLLSSFYILGPLVMPLLQATHQQHQQGMVDLVLTQSLRALCSPHKTPDVGPGSTEDVVERGAAALRVLCSSASSSGLPTSQQLLAGLQQGMVVLQQPQRYQQYQEAHSQLVAGLVHALHGVPPGDVQLRAEAEAAVRRHILEPLAAALQEAAALAAAEAGSGAAAATLAQQQARRAVVWQLHCALRSLQALLNGLESYAWYEESPSQEAAREAVSLGVAAAAVASFLAAWPALAEVCSWVGRLPAAGGSGGSGGSGASLAAARRELFSEAAHCLSSCFSLDQEAGEAALPSFADAAAACFFLPGGAVLSRPLIQALETYCTQLRYQQPLLGTVAAILSAPQARQLAALRGGDADPETAQALLSLLGCCLRQACQWQAVAQPAAVEAVLQLGVPLAVGNAACNHKDTALQAVGTLAALLTLVLAVDSPLHAALLGFAAQQGPALVQGLLLALLALSSGSHLPKIVSLMSDIALLAASLAIQQLQQPQQALPGGASAAEAVVAAAGALVTSWVAAARTKVTQSGMLTEEAMAALLAQWDWQPVLQQAAMQLMQQQQRNGSGSGIGAAGSGPNMAEVRRAMQRSVRQLADLIRRSSTNFPVAVA